MNLNKSREVFDPAKITAPIHIIGCGSVGSTIAELLARYGLTKFTLWDMDKVEEKNLVNQMFFDDHVGMKKVDALRDILGNINLTCNETVKVKPDGWHGEPLAGYVFLAVDDIAIRRDIVKRNQYNANIKAMFDVRTALFDAQLYAADWRDPQAKKALLDSMNFTHEEATNEVPRSACGEVLGVAPTVRMAATMTVINFQKFVTEGKIKDLILVAPFNLDTEGAITAM